MPSALTKKPKFKRRSPPKEPILRIPQGGQDKELDAALSLIGEGCYREAEVALAAIVEARPWAALAWYNRGLVAKALGDNATAETYLLEALKHRKAFAPGWNGLGTVYLHTDRIDEAEKCFRKAIALDGMNADAYTNLGPLLENRGEFEQAKIAFENAAKADPYHIHYRHNLGCFCIRRRSFNEAEEHLWACLDADERHADSWNALAAIYAAQGEIKAMRQASDRALKLDPDNPDYLNDRANYESPHAFTREVEALYTKAMGLKPQSGDIKINLALCLLREGRYCEGWALYEHRRWKNAQITPETQWRGEDLDGGTLLVRWEQGLGDTLMLSRLIPGLPALCNGKVIFAVQKSLVRLFEACQWPNVEVIGCTAEETLSIAHTAAVMLWSLPHILGLTLSNLPPSAVTLRTLEESHEKENLQNRPLRVGLCWAGGKDFQDDHARSLHLQNLLPLFGDGARYVSLQLGDAALQNLHMYRPLPLEAGLPPGGDWLDTARIVAGCDLVISVDTSVAHLSASLGVPTWILIRHANDWRWGRGETTPWYPSIRLLRQKQEGVWRTPIMEAAKALDALRRSQ